MFPRRGGAISGAAPSLGLSRTTAWRRLNALKAELGCRLVERTQRSNRLTETGQLVSSRGRRLIEGARAPKEAAQRAHCGGEGELRIAVTPSGEKLATQALAIVRLQLPAPLTLGLILP